MTTVIGNPSTLALEYCIADASKMMGYSRLWVGNASLGSIEELVYLDGYVMGCLQDLRRKGTLHARYAHLQGPALFHALDDDLRLSDQCAAADSREEAYPYLLQCGTLFDVYAVFASRNETGAFCVLWRLESPVGDLPYSDLAAATHEIHSAEFTGEQLDAVIEQFAQVITATPS